MSKVMKTCPKCKQQFQLGVNGAYNDKRRRDECDSCSGVKRDAQGYAWGKGDQFQHYGNGDGPTEKVSRRQAFAFKKGVNRQ